MSRLIQRKHSKHRDRGQSPTQPGPTHEASRDRNAPLRRLQLHQRCLYERKLPGDAFISAHVNRLQQGYYQSDLLHEPALDDVYFVSVHFVFHAHDHRSHRIRSAVIRVSVHTDPDASRDSSDSPSLYHHSCPKIIGHAPELIYGAISPENLQWNFSLSSSLGISQAPLTAALNPSGGVQSNYKIYDMMSIQGSLRSVQSPTSPEHDAEDAMAVWTLEENLLQRSGLPREFDFVLLVHKPANGGNVFLSVDVDARIEAWFGEYPQWYQNLPRFKPAQDRTIDLSNNIGQKFLPIHSARGFNFADLPHPLEEYVAMPGTTYPTNAISSPDRGREGGPEPLDQLWPGQSPPDLIRGPEQQPYRPGNFRGQRDSVQAFAANRQSLIPELINVRLTLDRSNPPSPSLRRFSMSAASNTDSLHQQSPRGKHSRPEARGPNDKQYVQELAQGSLHGERSGEK